MGMEFPAGEEMDRLAVEADDETELLTSIRVKDSWLNLSGIDTQIKNILMGSSDIRPKFIREIFGKLSDAVALMLIQGSQMTGITDILMAGGVSSSMFIRQAVSSKLEKNGISAVFENNDLSQDNAVGTALLGGKKLWL